MGLRAVVLAAVACLAGCGGDDEIVGLDRVGAGGASKQLRLQLNASFSPAVLHAGARRGLPPRLSTAWARRHPEWQIDLTIVHDSQGTFQQARLLEHAAHLAPGAPLRPPPRAARSRWTHGQEIATPGHGRPALAALTWDVLQATRRSGRMDGQRSTRAGAVRARVCPRPCAVAS